MVWATIQDVSDIAGATVTEAQRTQAVASLETMIGLIEAVPRDDIEARDLHFLKLATCFQARFVAENPDLFSRLDVTSASQDGQSAGFRNADAHILAPLARKSIRRLSWFGLTRPEDRAAAGRRVNVLSEAYDDSLPWRPV